jgi:cytochrome P450
METYDIIIKLGNLAEAEGSLKKSTESVKVPILTLFISHLNTTRTMMAWVLLMGCESGVCYH